MLRRLSLVFVFACSLSAGYTFAGDGGGDRFCDAQCYGLCGLEGIAKDKCKRICGC